MTCAGLGVDLTSTQLAVHNPLDTAEPDLPPSPLLVAATSDAKLQFYTLSHLRRPLAGIVSPPTPIPTGLPPLASATAAPAAAAPPQEDGGNVPAAQAGLPESSDDEGSVAAAAQAGLPETPDEESSITAAAQAGLPDSSDEEGSVAAAAAAELPDSDEESLGEGSEAESEAPALSGGAAPSESKPAASGMQSTLYPVLGLLP